jgi:hypothetical protein
MRCCASLLFLVLLFYSEAICATNGEALNEVKPPAKYLYPIVWKWMKGKADSAYTFTETSHPTLINKLKNAFQVRRAREFWYQKNMDSFALGHFNWLPVSNFLGRFQTIKGIYRSGFDMVEQTLGGFTVHISPVSRDSVRFTVCDIKSRWSLFLHLPFVRNIPYDRSRKRQKPMTDTFWTFEWTEAVSTRLFYQRRMNILDFPHRKYSGHNF